MNQPKTKYVTRKKRIRQLEAEIEQLKTQVKILTEMLDRTNAMLLRSRPRLARAVERDMHEYLQHDENLLPSEMPQELMGKITRKKITPQRPPRNLPLAPRADLVIVRNQNGRHIATPRPPKA
ncbi:MULTISPECIES: hypothetical protein [unclassified Tolypothrix]|uniref:Uncharacterized protein n=1 Tax=Microchaete diplosiphon TaxID=1197 RepID=Q6GZZ5_MICDP|nr:MULTISPECIES: hypothetical protein [unclassified Tolypothrix]AAT41974.1 hypothetical protein [Fremyella diplosiphon Fd33]BAY89648.1 hypothetical protein NIES3275_16510 [Microchaete diplosiphon NIES-3275]EKE97656.1 hypothetical protein FDUTEX481_05034 [Tolypothrix sp. PCC 7601]MBE9083232.1 hypothetical protein [Tolypothrix sp. LEGE 11397]UYD23918.1 hypothetical protein HGR01_20675 [Tolypothrix sp. PCC 7712]